MKTPILFTWQGGFPPQSDNTVDHQHKCMMEKCKLNWIGIKTNVMLQYQAIGVLSVSTEFLGLCWVACGQNQDIHFFIYLTFLELMVWLALCVNGGSGCPYGAYRNVGSPFPNPWKYHPDYFLLPGDLPLYYNYFKLYFWIFVKYVLSSLKVSLNEKYNLGQWSPNLSAHWNNLGNFRNADAFVPLSSPPKDCDLTGLGYVLAL